MSDAPTSWLRRLKKPLLVVLAVLLYLGTAAALGTWRLWPPQPYVALPDSASTGDDIFTEGASPSPLLIGLRPKTGSTPRVGFSRDGALVIGSTGDQFPVWETATGRLRFTLPNNPPLWGLRLSPDGRFLAARRKRLILFDLTTGDERPLSGEQDEGVLPESFSPDGKTVLATAPGSRPRLVDLATGAHWSPSAAPPRPPRPPADGDRRAAGPDEDCRFSRDGRWLVWAKDGQLRIFDVATHEERCAYTGQRGQLAFAPDGQAWAVAAGNEVRVGTAPSGEEQARLRGHTSPVRFLKWSPDGQRLASAAGREVKLWDAQRGQELATLWAGRPDCAVRFSPDGRFLCLAALGFQGQQGMLMGRGEPIPLWDLSKSPPEHVASVASANVIAPDGRVLAVIGDPDRPVDAWTIARRVPATTWEVGAESEYPAFTPDGKMVILAGHTTIVRGKLGTWLARGAAGGDGYQYKWVDVDTWRVRAVLDTDEPGVLSPDGRLLATGGGDKPVRLWRVPPRRPAGPSLVLIGLIGGLAFVILYRRRRPAALTPAPPPPA